MACLFFSFGQVHLSCDCVKEQWKRRMLVPNYPQSVPSPEKDQINCGLWEKHLQAEFKADMEIII